MASTNDGIGVTVTTGPELKRVANALRSIDKKMPTEFRKALRKSAKPMVSAAKKNARAIPVRAGDKNKLRANIAKGIKVQAKVAKKPSVRIVTSMPEKDQAIIPRGLSTSKGWRHPVFNTGSWVVQKPMTDANWFLTAMASGKQETQKNITKVLTDARNFVASKGGRI